MVCIGEGAGYGPPLLPLPPYPPPQPATRVSPINVPTISPAAVNLRMRDISLRALMHHVDVTRRA
jgi:hypothetical protein